MMNSPALSTKALGAIKAVVHDKMDAFALRDIQIETADDHGGDPAIFITARYDYTDTPIDPHIANSLTSDLRKALFELGEMRFPYIRHEFSDRQRVSGHR